MTAHPPAVILVVEDDPKLSAAYGSLLKSAGYTVHAVYNGREALEYIRSQGDPEMVLLDMRMPVMSGIEFLREYQPLTHSRTAVVVFSDDDSRTQVDEAYKLGVTHYILKARANSAMLTKLIGCSLASLARD